MIAKFFDDFTGRDTRLNRDAVTAHWTPLHEGGHRAFRTFARNLDPMMAQFARYAAALRRLDAPAAIIWGSQDPVLAADRMIPRFTADLSVDARHVHVLDGASHFLQEDRPHELATIIAGFVTTRLQADHQG